MEHDEDDLTRRARHRDPEAFGLLVKRHAGRATALAVVLVGNHADAVDLSQEAFVRAWRHIGTFRGHSSFFAWYCRILRNACFTWLKRHRRQAAVPLVDDQYPAGAPDPAILAERSDEIDRLWAAIFRLSTEHREIIMLAHFDNMSYKEMAAALEIPVGTVMSRLHGARKMLRSQLGGPQP